MSGGAGRAPHAGPHGWATAPCPPRLCDCSAAQYRATWSQEARFSKILISPKMLTDHMPDVLLRALDSVVAARVPAQGGPGLASV